MTKAASGSPHSPLAGLAARIFLFSALAPRINQHWRFSVINIPFYVTIIYHFRLQAYDLSVCFYRLCPLPCSASFPSQEEDLLGDRNSSLAAKWSGLSLADVLMTNDGCNKSYQILMPPLLIFISTTRMWPRLRWLGHISIWFLLNHDPHLLK